MAHGCWKDLPSSWENTAFPPYCPELRRPAEQRAPSGPAGTAPLHC